MAGQWYYTTNKQQMGPVTWDELRQLANSGLIKPGDLVWTEGMTEWVKASRQSGLFADDAAPATSYREDSKPPPARRTEKRRGREDEEDEDRPARKKSREGMAAGVKIALILGGVVLLLLLLTCGIVGGIFLFRGGGGGPVVEPGRNESYTVQLNPGQHNERLSNLPSGRRVIITVTSTIQGPRTDVDLHVLRRNLVVGSDVSIGPNSRVEFVAPANDVYRIRVSNLGPGTATSRVDIRVQ